MLKDVDESGHGLDRVSDNIQETATYLCSVMHSSWGNGSPYQTSVKANETDGGKRRAIRKSLWGCRGETKVLDLIQRLLEMLEDLRRSRNTSSRWHGLVVWGSVDENSSLKSADFDYENSRITSACQCAAVARGKAQTEAEKDISWAMEE